MKNWTIKEALDVTGKAKMLKQLKRLDLGIRCLQWPLL